MRFAADEHTTVLWGDCLARLRELPDASLHAVVTDPPYGLANQSAQTVADAMVAWARGDRERVPDGRGFMGRAWDAFVPPPAVWDEVYRVLVPGGHVACFAGTRMIGPMDLSIRMAGFEMRDTIRAASYAPTEATDLAWMYGSGFPKSMDVGKAIDKAAGAIREVVGVHHRHGGGSASSGSMAGDLGTASELPLTAPATDAAREWDGWGTALKPAWEPILLARKPLAGTVAANVQAHRTGAINVDACRVAHANEADRRESEAKNAHADFGSGARGHNSTYAGAPAADRAQYDGSAGRWPTNVLLAHHPGCMQVGTREVASNGASPARRSNLGYKCDGNGTESGMRTSHGVNGRETVAAFECHPNCQVAALDEQSGVTTSIGGSRGASARRSSMEGGVLGAQADVTPGFGDTGGASRFFPTFRYQAKASSRERPEAWGRNVKCLCLVSRPFDPETGALPPWHRRGTVCATCERPAQRRGHSTVKPQGLLRWLVDLLVAPGGVVIDPFAGSGSLGQAVAERGDGTRAVLIEADVHHSRLIAQRLGLPEPARDPSVPSINAARETACPITSPARGTDVATTADRSNTSRSGNAITDDASPTATTSTTAITTSSTTTPPTSSSSTRSRTSDCTPAASCATASSGSRADSATSSSRSPSSTGTSRRRGGRSTDAAAPVTSARSSRPSAPAEPDGQSPAVELSAPPGPLGQVAAAADNAELTALHRRYKGSGEVDDAQLWAAVIARSDELATEQAATARRPRLTRPKAPGWARR